MPVYSATADQNGRFSITVPASEPLAPGAYRWRDRITLPDGRVGDWSPYKSLVIRELDPSAAAYVGAMTTPPSAALLDDINNLFVGLRADGLLSLFENGGGLWDLAGETPQAALLNMVAPTKSVTLVNAPTHTPGLGITGDGVSAYVAFGLYSDFPVLGINNGAIVWVEATNLRSGTPITADNRAGSGMYACINFNGTTGFDSRWSMGTSGDDTGPPVDNSAGFGAMTRLDASGYTRWMRESKEFCARTPTVQLVSSQIRGLASSGGWSRRTLAFEGFLRGATDAQVIALRTRLTTFYSRRGVPV